MVYVPIDFLSTEPAEVTAASATDHVIAASVLLYHGLTVWARLHIIM